MTLVAIGNVKLLVFAHTPPPHHGQSYMVQLMLDGFGGDQREKAHVQGSALHGIECYHVNARISDTLQDIGNIRFGKFVALIGYCFQAIWVRMRYGVETFYYIPGPGKTSALWRDWLVLLLCRPFFKRTVLHWHAAGLGKWLEREMQIRTREMTFFAYKETDLSVVLSDFNHSDAAKLLPKRILKVHNGIPDPCPDFVTTVLPRRQARAGVRAQLLASASPSGKDLQFAGERPDIFQVLYLGHCIRSKGLFDALEIVRLANEHYSRSGLALRVHLNVAGQFLDAEERAAFDRLTSGELGARFATYCGFVSGEQKRAILINSDCMCFPSFYTAESFGLVLIEAMAFGLPIVTTRWRSLPELFPPGYPGLVDVRNPAQGELALRNLMCSSVGEDLRAVFLEQFTLGSFLGNLADALRSMEEPLPGKTDKSPSSQAVPTVRSG